MADFEFYQKDGLDYDRITRCLDRFPDPGLLAWKLKVGAKEAKRISKVAMNIGTNVDEAIRADVSGRKIPKLKTVESESCWQAYKQWRNDYKNLVLEENETVFNDKLRVAGTPDLKSGNIVIDVKCSSEIRDTYWLQTEFYGRCLESDYKAILRLDKNLGMYEYKITTLSDSDWEACRAAITLYRFFNKSVTDGKEDE